MVSPLNVKPYESAVTLDTLLTALSSIGAMVPAGGAAINEMAKRSDLSTVVDAINATQQQFQYQPRFDQTYGNLQAIAENPLISALAESQQAFGDMLYENTGSPLAGALGQVSLDALDLLDAVPSTAIFAGLRSLDNLGDAAVMTSHGSKTASQLRHDFSRAEELADSGIDPWQETGWFKGADGNWRYEIDDSDALFSFDNVRPRKDLYGQRVGLLPEGLSHNELYKAYPDLLNVSLHETQSPSYLGTHGNMFGDEYIGINSSQAPMPNKDQRSTALHESMHAIQDREGYARGGNVSQMESMERPLSPEWKAWNDMQADPLHHEYMRLRDDPARHKEIATMNADYHENVRPKMDEIDRKMKDVYSDSSLDALQKRDAIGALLDEQKAILDSHNSANSGKYPLDERITQVAKELRGKYGDAYGRSTPPERQIDAREAYRRLSGEVEARNVQSRRNLSLEDRRNLHPYQTMDYILEDQIVNPQTLELGRQHISGERLDESYITPLKRNGEEIALPMDEASRMARAREMGFDTTGYHGTGADIDEFQGITWISESPKLANEYAFMRGAKGGDANVMPLVAKQGNSFNADRMPKRLTVDQFFSRVIDSASDNGKKFTDAEWDRMDELRNVLKRGADESYGGNYDRHDFWFQSEDAFGPESKGVIEELMDIAGFDSIKMTEGGEQTIGIIKPKNIRSKNATFNPKKADSANLNAMLTDALMAQAASMA